MSNIVDHTEDLVGLVESYGRPFGQAGFLEPPLQTLQNVVLCDLAALYERRGDRLEARAAAGPLASDAIRRHVLHLQSVPAIQRALESRQPVALAEGNLHHEVLPLPQGHACMVVPLLVGDDNVGVVTLVRQSVGGFSDEDIERAGAYGQTLAVALASARQAERLDRYRRQLERHNRLLVEQTGTMREAGEFIEASLSSVMRELTRLARQVADADMPVLIRGERGTGKEMLARAIHGWSRRADRPFVKLSCAGMSEAHLEHRLFGHVTQDAAGQAHEHPGHLLVANHGTLLLDEIVDMPLATQDKLLRVLQDGVFHLVGSARGLKVDVRVIATSHVDLDAAVRAGRVRAELVRTLAAFPLELPPLRERPEDIAPIAERTLAGLAKRTGRGPWTLSPAARERLAGSAWPGNVGELVNALERATILQPRGLIEPRHLTGSPAPSTAAPSNDPPGAALLPLREAERRHLVAALRQTGGKIYGPDGAARLLDLKPTTLQSKLKKHGIDRLQAAGIAPSHRPMTTSAPSASEPSSSVTPPGRSRPAVPYALPRA